MNTLKLIRTLDEYLAEYESLCSQKEVEQSRAEQDGPGGEQRVNCFGVVWCHAAPDSSHMLPLIGIFFFASDRSCRAGDAGELDPEGAGEGGQALRRHGRGAWRQQEVLIRVSALKWKQPLYDPTVSSVTIS
jgi:hypothetical protein